MLVTVEGHHSSLRFAEEVGMVACLALEIPYCSCSRGDQVHFQQRCHWPAYTAREVEYWLVSDPDRHVKLNRRHFLSLNSP